MPKKNRRLTDKSLERITPPAQGRIELWDSQVSGLGLRIGSKRKTWQVFYRFNGIQRRKSLGVWPVVDVAEARKRAGAILDLARNGTDPEEQERKQREAEAAAETESKAKAQNTVKKVVERFCKREADQKRTGQRIRRDLEREVVERWGERPIRDVTPEDIIGLLDEIVDQGKPIAANRLRGHLQLLFKWAKGRRLVRDNPMSEIARPAPENKRQRVLTDDELKALWGAWDTMDYPFGALYKMLALTGARLSEAAEAQWSEIDLPRGVWTIPSERYKSDRAHEIPLSKQAVALIKALPRFTGPYIFSTTSGHRPVSGFSKAKAKAVEHSEVTNWTPHDIRRTVRTQLARLRVAHEVSEMVLGHAKPGLWGTYDQYSYEKEKRQALQRWANQLDRILTDEADKVVAIKTVS